MKFSSDDSSPTVPEVVGLLAMVALMLAIPVVALRQGSVNECVEGGYAAYRMVKGESLCLGVNSDGEWHIETWSSVQNRLE